MSRKAGYSRMGVVFANHLLSRTQRADNGCLLFTGRTNVQGYGCVGYQGRGMLAHTALWESLNGPRPAGMELDHVCHDPKVCKLGLKCPHRRCLDLTHIELVPKAHNSSAERNAGAANVGVAIAAAAAWRNAKTHCPHGHEWSKENTRIAPNKQRVCKECAKGWTAKYHLKRKLNAKQN